MTEKNNSNETEPGGPEDFIEHLRLQGIPEEELPSLEWVESALAFCEEQRSSKELMNVDTILAKYPGLIPRTAEASIALGQILMKDLINGE